MAVLGDAPMSRHQFSVAYTGETRGADHSISVEALAPALLAFGKLMREANAELNGKKARANVYVVSDFEHKCFNINFELAVGLYEQIKSLVGTDGAKSAKDILEWIGLLGGAPATVGMTFLGYLKWKRGRKTTEVTQLKDESQNGNVVIRVEGDHNPITINQTIYNLSHNPRALKATRDAFLPVGEDGFERVEVREGDALVSTISPSEVDDIIASCSAAIAETKEVEPEIDVTSAWLNVYSPVYDENADNWRFKLGLEVIYVDISETSIAHDAIVRGGALADDTYQVRLEITVDVDEKGNRAKPRYKALEVIRFIPAEPKMRQETLFPPERDNENDG